MKNFIKENTCALRKTPYTFAQFEKDCAKAESLQAHSVTETSDIKLFMSKDSTVLAIVVKNINWVWFPGSDFKKEEACFRISTKKSFKNSDKCYAIKKHGWLCSIMSGNCEV